MKKIISGLLIFAMVISMVCVVSADELEHATVELTQFDQTINFDGVVSNEEWGQPVAEANAQSHVCFEEKQNGGMSFTVWMGYDFEGLFLAVKTADEKHNNTHFGDDIRQMWDGDCLQLRVDEVGCTADQGLLEGGRDVNWSEKMSEFAFAMDADGATHSYSWFGVSEGMALDSGNGQYRIAHSGGYTTYELFIPWENIVEQAPCVGAAYGITVGLLDSDAGEKATNYMEWGSGLFGFSNRFGENTYGSNKIVFTDKTFTGGPSLINPNGDVTAPELVPPEKAEGEYIYFDLSLMEKPNLMSWDYNEDTKVASIIYSGSDSHIQYPVHKQVDASANDYKYLAIYGKTNTYLNASSVFFTTSAASSFDQINNEAFWFEETDEAQLVVLDLSLNGFWEGKIGDIRFDFIDPYGAESVVGTYEELATEIYAIALFKTEADAKAFKVAEIDVPDAVTLPVEEDDTNAPVETPSVSTEKPKEETTDGDTVAVEVTTSGDDSKGGGNGMIIAIVVAVVVVAAAGAGVFFFMKKKKKA